jgi:hypothetical protein
MAAGDINCYRNRKKRGRKMDAKFRDWKRKENVYGE